MKRALYKVLASLVQARINCSGNPGKSAWEDKHTNRIMELVHNFMPSGAGVDNGTKIDLKKSTGEKLVFHTGFHHMDEHGGYDGWTEHNIVVTPSLASGILLKISGKDRKQIKDYLYDLFCEALGHEVEY